MKIANRRLRNVEPIYVVETLTPLRGVCLHRKLSKYSVPVLLFMSSQGTLWSNQQKGNLFKPIQYK